MKTANITLVGNPNSGKTTLFNVLTGSHQHVANWPGVTVERVEGFYDDGDYRINITDLPGIYSFSAYSIDETLARDHILNNRPDLVINILDATNLERNLFLTTQLLEMRVPLVVALSMSDVAKKRRIHIEVEHLARHLGCPVVPIVATKQSGVEELKKLVIDALATKDPSLTQIEYDPELESAVTNVAPELETTLNKHNKSESDGKSLSLTNMNTRWLALRLLEQDEVVKDIHPPREVTELIEKNRHRVEQLTGEELDIVVADGRYGFIHGLAHDVVRRDNEVRKTVSDNIDRVLLNRFLGIPIFLAIMYLVFVTTINLSGPFIGFFDSLCNTIFVDGLGALLGAISSPQWLTTLLAEGLGGGITTVSTFIPPIFLIFLCMALLEDSGYMARAAFVMDRLLRTIGLPGKAFIPMLVGFGCNVPAILATRTLENPRDRTLTILMNPLMSCSARLPVYTLFVAAFFPQNGGGILFIIYLTGIILAIASGTLFKHTILSGEPATFVMELPPYHMPTFRGIMTHTWNRLQTFIIRAGKAILIVIVILGFLGSIGKDGSFGNNDTENSMLSVAAKGIAPVFYPLGLKEENWPGAVGLFTGLFAKESVVGTLDTLYSQMEAQENIQEEEPPFNFWKDIGKAFKTIPDGIKAFFAGPEEMTGQESASPLSDTEATAERLGVQSSTFSALARYFDGKAGAMAYLFFILIYAPCVAAMAAIYRETNLRWTLFIIGYLTGLAWLTSTLFYQTATFAKHPGSSGIWIGICLSVILTTFTGLKLKARKPASKPEGTK